MKALKIAGFVAVGLFAIATTTLWSQSPSAGRAVGFAEMPSLQALHTAAGANNLPVEEFEDQSLVYSSVPKR